MTRILLSRRGKIVDSIVGLTLIILSLGSIIFKTITPVTIFATNCFAGTLWVAWRTRMLNIKGMKYAAYFLCFAASTVLGGLGVAVMTQKIGWHLLAGTTGSVAAIALVLLVSWVSSRLQKKRAFK